jgi:hypothetical protein
MGRKGWDNESSRYRPKYQSIDKKGSMNKQEFKFKNLTMRPPFNKKKGDSS